MSHHFAGAPEHFYAKIHQDNLKYREGLEKGSKQSMRIQIRMKIRNLNAELDKEVMKIEIPNNFRECTFFTN